MSLAIPPQTTIVTGMLLHHVPSQATFKVRCNCPNVQPEHFRQRYVDQHRGLYRFPTPEEAQAYVQVPPRS